MPRDSGWIVEWKKVTSVLEVKGNYMRRTGTILVEVLDKPVRGKVLRKY